MDSMLGAGQRKGCSRAGGLRDTLKRLCWLWHVIRDGAHRRRGGEEALKVNKVLLTCSGLALFLPVMVTQSRPVSPSLSPVLTSLPPGGGYPVLYLAPSWEAGWPEHRALLVLQGTRDLPRCLRLGKEKQQCCVSATSCRESLCPAYPSF